LDGLTEGDIDEGALVEGGKKIRYGLTDEEIAEKIKQCNPDAIGVSCLFASLEKDMATNYPHFDFANFYLAEAYFKKGNIESATEYYEKTLKINPNYKEAKTRLSETAVRSRGLEKLYLFCSRVSSSNPPNHFLPVTT
jgi:tetratricopeptide (TPR) repeat protein